MIEDLEQQILLICRFCSPPERERIIYETENFYVLLSLRPITEGYCLLVSKGHFSCCAAIPIELRAEFEKNYNLVKQILNEQYGSCICYEHGRAGACMIPMEGSKHCYHAHMHFVPVDILLNQEVEKDFDGLEFDLMDNFFTSYENANKSSYLFVEDSAGKNLFFVDKKIRRQFLRFKTAELAGIKELWNWSEFQGWDIINAALKILPAKFNL